MFFPMVTEIRTEKSAPVKESAFLTPVKGGCKRSQTDEPGPSFNYNKLVLIICKFDCRPHKIKTAGCPAVFDSVCG